MASRLSTDSESSRVSCTERPAHGTQPLSFSQHLPPSYDVAMAQTARAVPVQHIQGPAITDITHPTADTLLRNVPTAHRHVRTGAEAPQSGVVLVQMRKGSPIAVAVEAPRAIQPVPAMPPLPASVTLPSLSEQASVGGPVLSPLPPVSPVQPGSADSELKVTTSPRDRLEALATAEYSDEMITAIAQAVRGGHILVTSLAKVYSQGVADRVAARLRDLDSVEPQSDAGQAAAAQEQPRRFFSRFLSSSATGPTGKK